MVARRGFQGRVGDTCIVCFEIWCWVWEGDSGSSVIFDDDNDVDDDYDDMKERYCCHLTRALHK
jgi:hypothetical protein